MSNWTDWKPFPSPQNCRQIEGPKGPGIYQIRNKSTRQLILFGIGIKCQNRMKSLMPAPYGSGTRNNTAKREYVFKNYKDLEYRTMTTVIKEDAKKIEDELKAQNNHLFNT